MSIVDKSQQSMSDISGLLFYGVLKLNDGTYKPYNLHITDLSYKVLLRSLEPVTSNSVMSNISSNQQRLRSYLTNELGLKNYSITTKYLKRFKYYNTENTECLEVNFTNFNHYSKFLSYFSNGSLSKSFKILNSKKRYISPYSRTTIYNILNCNELSVGWLDITDSSRMIIDDDRSLISISKEYLKNLENNDLVDIKTLQVNESVGMTILERPDFNIMYWDIETADITCPESFPYARVDGVPRDSMMMSMSVVIASAQLNKIKYVYNLSIFGCNEFEVDFSHIHSKNNKSEKIKVKNVICSTMMEMICEFVKLICIHKPYIISGFNDLSYDWVFLYDTLLNVALKAEINQRILLSNFSTLLSLVHTTKIDIDDISVKNMLKTNYYADKYSYNKFRKGENLPFQRYDVAKLLKITADTQHYMYISIDLPSILVVDSLGVLKRMYPDMVQNSLASFLLKLKIGGKDPFDSSKIARCLVTQIKVDENGKRVFDIDPVTRKFNNKEAAFWYDALCKYCVIDSLRLKQIYDKANFIEDIFSYAQFTHTDPYTIIYNAVSSKIDNCIRFHIQNFYYIEPDDDPATSHIKYTGAHVFPVLQKQFNDKPIIVFDYAALYPSVMMEYNLSPEKVLKIVGRNDPNRKLLEDAIIITTTIDAECENFNLHKYPDDKQVFYEITNFLESSNKDIHYYVKAHKNNTNSNDFGFIPKLLYSLFLYRVRIKDVLKHTTDEAVSAVMDAKQSIVKIMMNSVYGLMGDKNDLTSISMIELAKTITKLGKCHLNYASKHVNKVCQSKTVYGDTDSIFSHLLEKLFEHLRHILDPRESLRQRIIVSHNIYNKVIKLLNDSLAAIYGNRFLKMTYESLLSPMLFLVKKRYIAIKYDPIKDFPLNPDGSIDEAKFTLKEVIPSNFYMKGVEKKYKNEVISFYINKLFTDILSYENKLDYKTVAWNTADHFFTESTKLFPLEKFFIDKTIKLKSKASDMKLFISKYFRKYNLRDGDVIRMYPVIKEVTFSPSKAMKVADTLVYEKDLNLNDSVIDLLIFFFSKLNKYFVNVLFSEEDQVRLADEMIEKRVTKAGLKTDEEKAEENNEFDDEENDNLDDEERAEEKETIGLDANIDEHISFKYKSLTGMDISSEELVKCKESLVLKLKGYVKDELIKKYSISHSMNVFSVTLLNYLKDSVTNDYISLITNYEKGIKYNSKTEKIIIKPLHSEPKKDETIISHLTNYYDKLLSLIKISPPSNSFALVKDYLQDFNTKNSLHILKSYDMKTIIKELLNQDFEGFKKTYLMCNKKNNCENGQIIPTEYIKKIQTIVALFYFDLFKIIYGKSSK